MIAKQIHAKDFKIENQYKRVVKTLGNMQAQKIMDLVYKKASAKPFLEAFNKSKNYIFEKVLHF